jgi:protein-L-isoaspartate(D-aspartate) O-methyltransferase
MGDRKQMLRDIEMEAEFTSRYIGKSALDSRVMQAMGEVLRHEFVTPDMRKAAYENGPLPIGGGQTISQPYIVALMTDLLEPQPDDVILEVGTGSGYQAAVLSRVVRQVYSVEIVTELSARARQVLQQQGYDNVECRTGDGYYGWPEHAPYDGIMVTAAAPSIPQPLIAQLKPGGRLVLPLGQPFHHQELMVLEKREDGEIATRNLLAVAFVPLTGDHGE